MSASPRKNGTSRQVRITDPYIVGLVEEERLRRGDRSRAATAGHLIIERIITQDPTAPARGPHPSPETTGADASPSHGPGHDITGRPPRAAAPGPA